MTCIFSEKQEARSLIELWGKGGGRVEIGGEGRMFEILSVKKMRGQQGKHSQFQVALRAQLVKTLHLQRHHFSPLHDYAYNSQGVGAELH